MTDEQRPHGAWRALGLTDEEYDMIVQRLGRKPNWTELGMFSALWSEHCSYKHSRSLFSLFPTDGPHILQGLGENAGVVDVGDGLAVTFKVESHNHPTAVEPFQGAATGVGGILRDIVAMGARPIAVLTSSRFGSLASERARYLFKQAVAGMSWYANTVGVPGVGGEVGFDEAFEETPLANVMAVGLVERGKVALAAATGVGNPVMVVGARTGRDGIHGASFSSATLGDDETSAPSEMQVGDPETERRLIEACLEAIESGAVVAIQDMGAAGLTSSSAEMAAKGGTGMELDLALVPCRDEGMTPFEIMLSESQERMLVVPRKGEEERVRAIFSKWELEAAVIGRVTDDGMLRLKMGDRLAAEVPAAALSAEGAPLYHPASRRPAYLDEVERAAVPPAPEDLGSILTRLLADPNVASKAWAYSQFDAEAQGRTLLGPGAADAAALAMPDSAKGLAMTIDGNSLHCFVDPYTGAAAAVAEAARNLACVGAKPMALTDGLNFGSPKNPEAYWQLRRSVEGIAAAAKALGTPVIGGNVSLYNEFEGQPVYPTPIIGMVGLIDDVERRVSLAFKSEGDAVYLLGRFGDDLGGSRYLKRIFNVVKGPLPALDLELEKTVQRGLLAGAKRGLLQSAHDISEGGFAVALAEKCVAGNIGVSLRLPAEDVEKLRVDGLLFGEGYSRALASVAPQDQDEFEGLLTSEGVPWVRLGEVGGDKLEVTGAGKTLLKLGLNALADAWRGSVPAAMEGDA